jgi:hypothetical protein
VLPAEALSFICSRLGKGNSGLFHKCLSNLQSLDIPFLGLSSVQIMRSLSLDVCVCLCVMLITNINSIWIISLTNKYQSWFCESILEHVLW